MADHTSNTDSVSRPLGGAEHSWSRSIPGGTGITVLVLLLSKPLHPQNLQTILHNLQLSHPLLRSKLNPSSTPPSLTISPSPAAQIQFHDHPSTSLLLRQNPSLPPFQQLLEHELSQNQPWSGPSDSDTFFCNLYTVEENNKWVLAFRLHTSICDRTSGVILLRDLLSFVREEKGVVSRDEFNLAIEDLIPSGKANKPFWSRGVDLIGYSLNSFRFSNLQFKDVESPRSTGVVRLQLSSEQTDLILAGCKSRGIKLCGVISAAAIMAAYSSKHLPDHEREKYGVTNLVDCRKELEPPLQNYNFGFYHSAVLNTHDIAGETELWELAISCYTCLKNARNSNKTPSLKPTTHHHPHHLSLQKLSDPHLNFDTFATSLQHCARTYSFQLGTQIHARLIHLGLYNDVYLSSKLLYFYCCNNDVDSARFIFDSSPIDCLNLFFWNTMIRAYVDCARYSDGVELFLEMWGLGFCPNEFTYPFVFKACCVLGFVELGREIHGVIVKNGYASDTFAGSALLDLYVKCGCFGDACKLFDRMPKRNEVTWNSMVSGYAQNGCWEKALEALEVMGESGFEVGVSSWNAVMAGCVRYGDGVSALEMLRRMLVSDTSAKPNSATFNTLLSTIQKDASLIWLKEMHCFAIKQREIMGMDSIDDDRLRSAIAAGYASCGCMAYASRLFEGISLKTTQLWISMISGFIDCKQTSEAFRVFRDMVMQCGGEFKTLSKVPLTLLLPECNGSSLTGLEIHAHAYRVGFESNTSVNNALIAMYARRNEIELSKRVFTRTPEKDVISWNTMISTCVNNNDFAQAFTFFHKMHAQGTYPDEFTVSSVLAACGELGAHRQGLGVHGYIIRSGLLDGFLVVQNSLLDMYGKCGCVDEARKVFNEITRRDVISWNTMISCYGINALPHMAFLLFDEMQSKGWKPNRVTFIALLSACSHAGLVSEALHFFQSMTEEYRISPDVEHYACVVDTLGRAGLLEKAYNLIKNMSVRPDDCVWSALLSGCRIHGNVALAEIASRHLIQLKPQHSGYHVLLSNIYTDASRQKDAADVRTVMKDMGVKKFPGYSWIEVGGELHNFFTADRTHKQSSTIYFTLDGLTEHLISEGYAPRLASRFLS